jgi:hypothetical protein
LSGLQFFSRVLSFGEDNLSPDFDQRQGIFGQNGQSCDRPRYSHVIFFPMGSLLSNILGAGSQHRDLAKVEFGHDMVEKSSLFANRF